MISWFKKLLDSIFSPFHIQNKDFKTIVCQSNEKKLICCFQNMTTWKIKRQGLFLKQKS